MKVPIFHYFTSKYYICSKTVVFSFIFEGVLNLPILNSSLSNHMTHKYLNSFLSLSTKLTKGSNSIFSRKIITTKSQYETHD